jgi:predicted alpha-1,2-mannosidase
MKNNLLRICILFYCTGVLGYSANLLTDYVDPKIGTLDIRESNCVIGPQMPFGSINPSPQTPNGTTAGYNPKFPVRGFGQLHVSGTGGPGKYGHFLVSPQRGVALGNEDHDSPVSKVVAKAYYFSCNLDRYDTSTEITPTPHCAMYRFTFPESDDAAVVFDATQNIPIDILKRGGSILENKASIDPASGMVKAMITFQGGWSGIAPYTICFVARFNKAPAQMAVWKNQSILNGHNSVVRSDVPAERIGSVCQFLTKQNEPILMKAAISFASYENAERFLENEIPAWDFDQIKAKGLETWEKQLNKIKIGAATEEQKGIFYTALYHSMLMPRDRTGDNAKWQSDAPYWDDHYAIWDTWRALFPLHLLINPDMVRGNILSFIDRLKHNGQVRDSFIGGVEGPSDQGGNNVDNIIADAYMKNLSGVNWDDAYAVLKNNADNDRLGFTGLTKDKQPATPDAYRKQGWIPNAINSSSATLEYAYNDFSISQVAKGLGKKDDYEKYLKRSRGWESLWDTHLVDGGYSGFVGVKSADGNFSVFDVRENAGYWNNPLYEGSSWTYTYFTPHDFPRLIELMGGAVKFSERLEYALNHDLIDCSNEPSFLTTRAFNHAGRPDLASKWVRHVMNMNYNSLGVTGNDDSGAMSSWYIFSALGFFPNAGQNFYYLNAPLYEKSQLQLENGKTLTLIASNPSDKNIYIKSCRINGKPWNSSMIKHEQIANGATIEFDLTSEPTDWGKNMK